LEPRAAETAKRADGRAPLRQGLDLATHCGVVRLAERADTELAHALFVTTKTIDMHLDRSYSKLGINSRKQLAAALEREHT
jgi:Bacterial regulatory proteins, luxR family